MSGANPTIRRGTLLACIVLAVVTVHGARRAEASPSSHTNLVNRAACALSTPRGSRVARPHEIAAARPLAPVDHRRADHREPQHIVPLAAARGAVLQRSAKARRPAQPTDALAAVDPADRDRTGGHTPSHARGGGPRRAPRAALHDAHAPPLRA